MTNPASRSPSLPARKLEFAKRRAPLAPLLAFSAACGLFGSPAAFAQSKFDVDRVLGRDDLEFARALADAGYNDLALRLVDRITSDTSWDANDRAGADDLKIAIASDVAGREKDVMKRVSMLRDGLKQRLDYLASHADAPNAGELREQLARSAQSLLEAILTGLQQEKDEAKLKELRDIGTAVSMDGLKAASQRASEIEAQLEQKPDDTELRGLLGFARHSAARTRFLKAMLYAPNDLGRDVAFTEALDAFDELSLDFADQLVCYDGFILQSILYGELGRNDDALESVNAAIALREGWEPDAKGRYQMPPEAIEVVGGAVDQKMKLLVKLGKAQEAVDAGQQFLDTTPPEVNDDALDKVRVQLAEAHVANGAPEQAAKIAKQLMESDPQSVWAARGREILARASGPGGRSMGAGELLRLADSQIASGDLEGATDTARRALGDRPAGKPAVDALMMLAAIYTRREMMPEATAALDGAAELGAGTDDAADALWRAINLDLTLRAAEGNKAFYKKRVDARLSRIAKEHPSHPAAGLALLIEGKELETQKEHEKAALAYERIPTTAQAYEEARFRAGYCWSVVARKLKTDGKEAESKAALAKADKLIRESIALVGPARQKTLDQAQLARLDKVAFDARMSLAGLTQDEGKHTETLAMLDEAEKESKGDADRMANVWKLRIESWSAMGKLEDAEKALDKLIKSDPGGAAACVGSGMVARALDTKAGELKKADPKSKEARELYLRACRYYEASLRRTLDNKSSLSTTDIQRVAERIFALALDLNDVPLTTNSSLGSDPKKLTAPEVFEQAARLFAAALERVPSYRNEVLLARCYGFLGKQDKVADTLAKLFENETFVNEQGVFVASALKAKPELLVAWLEWGAAELEVGVKTKDDELKRHALHVFESTCRSLKPEVESNAEFWWRAKYMQLRGLADLGDYDKAAVGLRTVNRTSNDYDGGRFGLRDKFIALEKEIAPKVTNPDSSPPAGGGK